MTAVYIHHLPFFSTPHPHSYTVSPGSGEGMGGRNDMDNKLLLPVDKERVLPVSKKKAKIVL